MVVQTATQLPIILRPGEDGWVIAECPLIPGCVTQGRDRDEALENAREAVALCLETREQEGWQLPEHYELIDVPIAS